MITQDCSGCRGLDEPTARCACGPQALLPQTGPDPSSSVSSPPQHAAAPNTQSLENCLERWINLQGTQTGSRNRPLFLWCCSLIYILEIFGSSIPLENLWTRVKPLYSSFVLNFNIHSIVTDGLLKERCPSDRSSIS